MKPRKSNVMIISLKKRAKTLRFVIPLPLSSAPRVRLTDTGANCGPRIIARCGVRLRPRIEEELGVVWKRTSEEETNARRSRKKKKKRRTLAVHEKLATSINSTRRLFTICVIVIQISPIRPTNARRVIRLAVTNLCVPSRLAAFKRDL